MAPDSLDLGTREFEGFGSRMTYHLTFRYLLYQSGGRGKMATRWNAAQVIRGVRHRLVLSQGGPSPAAQRHHWGDPALGTWA
jgi:hypothetical protein